jgi:hypothetical protein
MHPIALLCQDLLQRQLRDGFPDLVGTDVTATIPISDRAINELIAGLLPAGGKIREVTIASEAGNQVTVKVRLSGPAVLPTIPVTLAIEDQPDLPSRPVLGLRLSHASRFVALAASALPAMVTLPPGITMDHDRILIDLRRLLAERGLDTWLEYVTDLRLTTSPGAVVLGIRAGVGTK